MTQDMQTARDDLAFMRVVAQQGRRAPLMSGRFLLSAGLVYSATSVVAWAIMTQLIPVPSSWQTWLWLAVTVVYVPSMRLVAGRIADKPGVTSVNNQAVAAVWQGLGFAMIATLGAGVVVANVTKTSAVFAIFPSLVLAVYGMAWWLSASMSALKWVRWVSAACFAAAVLIGFLIQSASLFLAFAAAILLLVALPGWLLMQAEGDLTPALAA